MNPEEPVKPEGQPSDNNPTPEAPAPAGARESAPKPRADEERLAKELRESLRRRRPRRLLRLALGLAVLAVPVALWVWLWRPGAAEPPVLVTAFDQVTVQGEPVTCRARLEPADPAR